jgi:RNA polymerase sigma-70 factor (ECF subfamily)
MRLANAGDRLAYQDLLHEVGQAAEDYLRRHFGDGDFLEDCVQESLLAIHRARESWNPQRSLRPWLFTIIRHKAIDFLRRRGTRLRSEVGVSEERREAVSAQMGASAHARVEVAGLLSRLEPKYRDALVLTKLRGYSLSEAAAELGVSTPAMKTRVHRAIAKAQQLLGVEET